MLNRLGRPLLLVRPSLARPKKVSKNISVRSAGSISTRTHASSSPTLAHVWAWPGGTDAVAPGVGRFVTAAHQPDGRDATEGGRDAFFRKRAVAEDSVHVARLDGLGQRIGVIDLCEDQVEISLEQPLLHGRQDLAADRRSLTQVEQGDIVRFNPFSCLLRPAPPTLAGNVVHPLHRRLHGFHRLRRPNGPIVDHAPRRCVGDIRELGDTRDRHADTVTRLGRMSKELFLDNSA